MVMPSYEEIFSRNIGVFSKEDQERIRGLSVSIAGVGALGGPVAVALARLGVGEIRLIDPEVYEPSNINRQFGAYVDTIGKSKAKVIGEEVRRVNPECKVSAIHGGLNHENVDAFLHGVDIVVDAIDFFVLDVELLLHEKAIENNQWIFTSQAAGEILSFTSFNPQGATLSGTLSQADGSKLAIAISAFFPRLPRKATPELIDALIKGEKVHISSHASPPMIGGGLLVEQILAKLLGRDFLVFPDVVLVDLESLEFVKP